MAPDGMRITRAKRMALATCNGLLIRACDELDELMNRGANSGLDVEEVEDIGPLAMRIVELRRQRRRLEAELHAITTEWAG
jgi:hypothetical protein